MSWLCYDINRYWNRLGVLMIIVNAVLLATFVGVVLLWGFNWVTIWSAVPLLSAAVLSEIFLSSTKEGWGKATINQKFRIMGMVAGVILVTLYFHLSLYFGWIESVSLRAGQKMMIVPLYVFAGGIFGYTSGHILGNMMNPNEELPPSETPPTEESSGQPPHR